MAFLDIMEGLADRVTTRWRAGTAELPSQSTATPALDRDTNEYGNFFGWGSAYDWYIERVQVLQSRRGMAQEYDEMDEQCPEFSSAMDIYADNATRGSEDGVVSIGIVSDNERVVKVLSDLRDRLNLEKVLWTLARDVAKYGERMEEVVVGGRNGNPTNVVRMKPLPTVYIFPQKDKYGLWKDPAYIQVNEAGDPVAEFKQWQVLHFANKKSRGDTFGRGLGFAARKPFKQLRMMEDAVVIARLTRAHNRLAYLVDTGSLPPEEADAHLQKVKARLRKRRMVSQRTGTMDLEYNPLSVEEDIFVARGDGSQADVKTLQGDLTVGNIDDLEYFKQKIFTALHVPKAYLAHEKETNAKAVLTGLEIQFARSVRRIQFVIQDTLRPMFDLELKLNGIDPKAVSYRITLPCISVVDELRQWQTEQLRMLVAQMFKQTFWPDDLWILTNIMGLSTEEAEELIRGQKKPDQYNGLYQAPKVGTVSNNTKKAEMMEKLVQMDPEEFAQFERAVEDLRMLLDWQAQSA